MFVNVCNHLRLFTGIHAKLVIKGFAVICLSGVDTITENIYLKKNSVCANSVLNKQLLENLRFSPSPTCIFFILVRLEWDH